jgi:hypothetical protein
MFINRKIETCKKAARFIEVKARTIHNSYINVGIMIIYRGIRPTTKIECDIVGCIVDKHMQYYKLQLIASKPEIHSFNFVSFGFG